MFTNELKPQTPVVLHPLAVSLGSTPVEAGDGNAADSKQPSAFTQLLDAMGSSEDVSKPRQLHYPSEAQLPAVPDSQPVPDINQIPPQGLLPNPDKPDVSPPLAQPIALIAKIGKFDLQLATPNQPVSEEQEINSLEYIQQPFISEQINVEVLTNEDSLSDQSLAQQSLTVISEPELSQLKDLENYESHGFKPEQSNLAPSTSTGIDPARHSHPALDSAVPSHQLDPPSSFYQRADSFSATLTAGTDQATYAQKNEAIQFGEVAASESEHTIVDALTSELTNGASDGAADGNFDGAADGNFDGTSDGRSSGSANQNDTHGNFQTNANLVESVNPSVTRSLVSGVGPLSDSSPTSVTAQISNLVVQEMKLVEGGTHKMLTLQLHPAELGQVTIQLDLDHDGLKAQILTSEAMANELLNQNKAQLVTALAESGIEFSSLDVSHQEPKHEQPDGSDREGKQANREPANKQSPSTTTSTKSLASSGNAIDIVV